MRLRGTGAFGLALACVLAAASSGRAVTDAVKKRTVIDPASIQSVDRRGSKLPIELAFRDESGKQVRLGDLVSGERPFYLLLVYYECPSLCNLTLNAFTDNAKHSRYRIGRDYDVITVSIDPGEGPDLARDKKASYLEQLGQPEAGRFWHWLTGEETAIRKLADAVGFAYKYDPVQDEYAHSSLVYAFTPDGRLSRELPGIQQKPEDFDLALLEASNGKIARGIVDRIALVCYRYDPEARGYVLSALAVMKLAGVVIVLFIGTLLFVLWRREVRRARRRTTEAGVVDATPSDRETQA
ncbi:MAG: SCO family protein [Planctomycetota bacterium]|nr:MAG: SCO family protein [Planctomycetota bacterium]